MRSVVIDTPGQVRVESRPDPELSGSDGAIVQVSAAAICGSDLHFYDGERLWSSCVDLLSVVAVRWCQGLSDETTHIE